MDKSCISGNPLAPAEAYPSVGVFYYIGHIIYFSMSKNYAERIKGVRYTFFGEICGQNFAPLWKVFSTRYERQATRDEFGQTRRYSHPKSEHSKKIFRFFNSLFCHDLSSFSVRCTLPAVRCFSTKRAASPHCRETLFFCPRFGL